MRRIGPYHVAGLGNGTFIVCGEIECFLVEADNPENAVKTVEEYLKSILGRNSFRVLSNQALINPQPTYPKHAHA